MQVNTRQKLITCILPCGIAFPVMEKLKQEKAIITATINYARGMGKLTPLAYRGVGEQTEKEILQLVIPAERGDEIFEYIYITADINRPHGGIIYMSTLQMATPFVLPDLPGEE